MNRPTHPFKRGHVVFVALLALTLGALALACGSNDEGPGACQGGSCIEGGASDGSALDGPLGPDSSSGDASDARADADAALDAAVDADGGHPPYTGNHLWSKLFGSNASSSVAGAGVATDSAGNVFVVGTLTGDADFGGGVLTGVGADAYVAKFTKDGNHLWSKKFGDADVQGAGQIAVDATGSVFVGGNFNGTIDFGGGNLTSAGGYDIFVAKLDTNGNHVWSKGFGDAQLQNLTGMTLVGSDVVFTGTNSGSVDFGGGALTRLTYLARLAGSNGAHVWSKQPQSGGFEPSALTTDFAGNILGVGALVNGFPMDWGQGTLTSAGGNDVLVIKFDPAGDALWNKRFGDNQFQDARAAVTNASGDIFLTGRLSGTLDFGVGAMTFPTGGTAYVAKLDKTGTALWSKSYPVTAGGLASSTLLAIDQFGNVAVAGNTHDAIDFGGGPLPCNTSTTNIFIAKLDTTGKHLWSKGWATGAGGTAASVDVSFDGTGSMLFTGAIHQTTIDMGGGPLATIGAGGFLVLAKLAP